MLSFRISAPAKCVTAPMAAACVALLTASGALAVSAGPPARPGGAAHPARLGDAVRPAGPAAVAEVIRPGGHGYWATYADGAVEVAAPAVSYGDLTRYRLTQPIVGMASTPDGGGYWLVASDGGIFSFGDARFHGSTGGVRLDQPIVGMAPTAAGGGYWLVAGDGGIFNFGDARFHGSASTTLPAEGQSAIGVTGAGQGGYWIESSSGQPLAFDAPLPATGSPAAPSPAAAGPGQTPAAEVPATSVAPSAAFEQYCLGGGSNPLACDQAALADIDAARAREGYGPLVLPLDYGLLTVPAQLVATANAERASRGLPTMAENSAVDSMAATGARNGTDPRGPAGYGWAGNWAYNYPTALAADFVWMYDDGPASPNIDCTAGNQSGCWGHRRNILSPWGGAAGGGAYEVNGGLSLTELFVENY